MSSMKNYELEITPPLSEKEENKLGVIKFTVKGKSQNLLFLKVSAGIILISILVYDLIISSYGSLGLMSISSILESFLEISNGRLAYWVGILSILCLLFLKQDPEDSLIVMKDIGIQLISKKSWRFQKMKKDFVPLNTIIDLVIHEGFHNYGQVIFYLCILTKSNSLHKGDNLIKVVFPEFLPRKQILTKVWKQSRGLLFGENRRYWRRVPGQGLKQII